MLDFIDYNSPGTTIITGTDVIDGNIISSDCIENRGKVFGYVSCDGLLSNYGQITGTVNSSNLILRANSQIFGNCQILFDGLLENKSLIRGDVQCNNIEVFGKIYGNIKATGKVIIRSGGEVYGDISTSDLCVESSAVIVGKVKYTFNKYKS
ncbi:MAG: polymer-forming cytoskeletal protein [Erysipelotrichaceae bacterium]